MIIGSVSYYFFSSFSFPLSHMFLSFIYINYAVHFSFSFLYYMFLYFQLFFLFSHFPPSLLISISYFLFFDTLNIVIISSRSHVFYTIIPKKLQRRVYQQDQRPKKIRAVYVLVRDKIQLKKRKSIGQAFSFNVADGKKEKKKKSSIWWKEEIKACF